MHRLFNYDVPLRDVSINYYRNHCFIGFFDYEVPLRDVCINYVGHGLVICVLFFF